MGALSSSNLHRPHQEGKAVCGGCNHTNNVDLKKDLECTSSHSKAHVSKKDFEYLIGKLNHFPVYTEKLFSLGKLYLDTSLCGCGENHVEYTDTQLTRGVSGVGLDPADQTNEASNVVFNSGNDFPKVTPRINNYSRCLFTPLARTAPLLQSPTYTRWEVTHQLNTMYSICSKKARTIMYLQPIEQFPSFINCYEIQIGNLQLNLIQLLQGFLEIFFSGFEVLTRSCSICTSLKRDIRVRTHELTGQTQLCVTDIHPILQKNMLPDGKFVVAISWTDLYPENFNFVLGEASYRHGTAVVSFGRFETKGYNADTHKDICEVNGALLWKLLKTISHEACHLLGLEHCTFFSCAMNESGSVAEAMSQPIFLCPVCLRKLHQACKFDVLERYQQLYRFLSEIIKQHTDCEELKLSVDWYNSCIQYLTESR